MKFRMLILCVAFISLAAVSGCGEEGVVKTTCPLKLADGKTTEAVTLSSPGISATFAPALGGKIISIKDSAGNEYLSRSTSPYASRRFDMTFGDSEFDGIDELFPTLGECSYPSGPLKGKKAVGHGELFRIPWKTVPGEGIVMEADGVNFPYRFRRQARIEKSTLILDYTVTNTSDHPFHYLYTFHPLFKGTTGCRLDTPADSNILVSWSTKAWLGKPGTMRKLGEIKDAEGGRFLDKMFVENTGRYWKFFTEKLAEGSSVINYADGCALKLQWPAPVMPYYAVWCSEGSTGGLHHIAPEPVMSHEEALDKAIVKGDAPLLPAKGEHRWTIRITVTPPKEK